ncbi:MAG: hypothetical protein Q4G68_04630 [Planctomycetia bacterium]|nr:hypothetical protein [Planctomycetia bacterium]
MVDRTVHQEKIIKRYYENRDAIMLEKLGELASELYLAEGKRRQQLWKRAKTALTNLNVPEDKIDAMIARDDPASLAVFLKGKF